MSKRFFLIVCLFGLGFSLLHAQWRLGVKNHLDPQYNTRVLLDYTASSDREKAFVAEVSFREEKTHRVILSKEVRLNTSGTKLFELLFQLNPGTSYIVDVDLLDVGRNERKLLSLDYLYRVNDRQEVGVSDIYLSYQADPQIAFQQPLLSPVLDPDRGKLYYFMELESADYEALTFRAELYEQQRDADQQAVSFLVSINQTSRVQYLGSQRKIVFQDSFDIQNLPSGQYQIDVRIYQEAQRLAAKTETFQIGSDLKKWIYGHMDEAFQMMVYVVPPSRIDSLLATERDTFVRREAFNRIWSRLYEDQAEEEMERYFRKVFLANERYQDKEVPGWETDRGRIYILYGEPKEKNVEIGEKSYLRWTYPRWSLSFLFEERNQGYELVE